jgi:hypothetical protein
MDFPVAKVRGISSIGVEHFYSSIVDMRRP